MVNVQILSFNDYHGYLDPSAEKLTPAQDPSQSTLGGAEYLSTELTQLRDKVRYDIPRRFLVCRSCGLDQLEPQAENLREYYAGDYRRRYTPVIDTELDSAQIFAMYQPLQASRVALGLGPAFVWLTPVLLWLAIVWTDGGVRFRAPIDPFFVHHAPGP